MNFKRIGRVLVCLLLVFCLIVNVSPIRAEAVSLSVMGTAVSVVAWDVLAAAFIGCGIAAAADRTDFDAVVDAAEDYYKSVGVIDSNGAMDIYSLQNAGFSYGLPIEFVQGLFDWTYETGIVLPNRGVWSSHFRYEYNSMGYDYKCDSLMGCFAFVDSVSPYDGCVRVIYYNLTGDSISVENFNITYGYNYDGEWVAVDVHDSGYGVYYHDDNITSSSLSVPMENLGSYDSDGNEWTLKTALEYMLQTTLYDVTMTNVAPAGSTIAAGYEEWYENSVTIQDEDGNDVQVIPIGDAVTDAPASDYTQEEIWTGAAPTIIVIEDSNTGDAGTTTPDVDPNPDVTPDTDALTQAGFDASLATFLASLGAKLAEWFDKQFGILDAICGLVESIYGYVESIAEFIASILTLFEPVAEWFEALITGQTTIIDSIIALPGAIGDIFENIIGAAVDVLLVGIEAIFVPSEDFLTVKVESIRARFEIADSIMATGEAIRGMLTSLGGEPPVIYIHLEDSEGSYDYGGTVPILDMRWYERYKSTGDKLLSSLIWLFFAWRCFVHAPNIISGIAGNIEVFNIPSDGVYTKDSGGLLGGNSWLGTWNEYQRGKYESKRKSRR